MLFYRLPDTWAPQLETAKKSKASLVAALSSLNDSDNASAFEGMCAHTVVAQMRRDAQVPAREVPHRQDGPLAVWAAGPLALVKKEQGASEEEQEPGQGRGKRRRREVSAGMVAVSTPAACEVEKAIVAEASVAQSMAVSSGAAEAQGDLAASGQAEAASGQAEARPASTTSFGPKRDRRCGDIGSIGRALENGRRNRNQHRIASHRICCCSQHRIATVAAAAVTTSVVNVSLVN